MVKYFLKNTEQEVKIGNTVILTVPGRTPYGEGKCEVQVLVTQETLQQLVKDGLVEARDLKVSMKTASKEIYRPFIRRLARRLKISFDEALDVLDCLLDSSPYAHNCLLVDLMAEVFNKDKKFGSSVYIIDMATNRPLTRTVSGPFAEPVFADFEDAKRVCALLTPFVAMAVHGRK